MANENYSGAQVVKPIIVGYHGLETTFKPGSCQLIESHGAPVASKSLYLAQLKIRFGVEPVWLEPARCSFDIFMANGFWK